MAVLKQRRVLPLFLFLFPTSLLAFLLLLLLACNGFLCFTTEPITYHTPFSVNPRSQILALKEEIPLPEPEAYQRLDLLQESRSGSTSPPTKVYQSNQSLELLQEPDSGSSPLTPSSLHKFKLSKRSKAFLKNLHSNARSRQFSARAEEFFHGSSPNSSKSPCKSRFFMTWISSLESFGRREVFTMESLFNSHPEACLLILSNTMDSATGARLLRPFWDMGYRVTALSPDYIYLFKNTPAEPWFARLRKGGVNPGYVSLGQNLSNLLRLAVLYKYGGVYIDTDVILLKSFSGLRNTIGAQTVDAKAGNWSRLNNAVMVFNKKHPLLYKFIEEFALTFDGSKWGHNGPYLVSRVVKRLAGRPGFEFTVLPPEAFYPVGWSRIGGLFRHPRSASHSKWVATKLRGIREGSFAVHLWNRHSRKSVVEEGSIVEQLMADHCVFCNSSVSSL